MTGMVTIREEDLIASVADALQYISYFHPMDYIRALGDAYEAELERRVIEEGKKTDTAPAPEGSTPVVTPAEPVAAPAEPVVAPAEPVVTPAEPVVAPAEPVVTPAS